MSESGSDTPLYRFVEESSGKVLLSAQRISGFFVNPDHAHDDVLIFGSARELVHPGEDMSDVELRVVDAFGKTIGSYYIGRVGLRSALPSGSDPGQDGFVATFYGYTCPYAAAEPIWRRWASGDSLVRGEWMRYPAVSHASWLHVVQNSWFETGHEAKMYGAEGTCVIDGRQVVGEGSLYCALGEAFNGPGGYFGATLDGLADCLASSGNSGNPFQLVWEYFSSSEELIGASLVASVLDTLSEFGVEVIPR